MRIHRAVLLVFLLLLGPLVSPHMVWAVADFKPLHLATVPDDVLVMPPVRFNPQGTAVGG